MQKGGQIHIKVYVFEYNVITVPGDVLVRCPNTFVHIVYVRISGSSLWNLDKSVIRQLTGLTTASLPMHHCGILLRVFKKSLLGHLVMMECSCILVPWKQ